MPITIVAAMDNNRVIGCQNRLPWHLPDDLKHFKALTMGTILVMGRKTYASLPAPLPEREHWILSRSSHGEVAGGRMVASIEEVLGQSSDANISVIGGGEIYAQLLPYADRMALTMVDGEVKGDTFFPKWDEKTWQEVASVFHPKDDKHAFDFHFVTLERIG